ncbi:GDSL-like Lipase/Acylhydrolase family protein [Collimonas arenae]|uniref:GDSL-like Lipase/Acylhydrolase family protein n=2 Tax=Collimonas arenae TaxID=279058 RepID=A0A127QJF7_9BURK|nr:GDSL-like Lipase/Acylhydrolase family protein [Collimonas arenae]
MQIIDSRFGNMFQDLIADTADRFARSLRLAALLLGLFGLVWTNNAYSASKSILVLGDSLSAEYGLARGSGWVALLQQRLQQEKLDDRITNASISGETTSGGKARLAALLQQRPDIVIIELGANDALRGLQLKATEDNLRSMIDAVQKAKAKVLLVGMRIPPNYGRDYTDKFFALYGTLAKQTKVPLVPFLLAGVPDKPEMFQADRIHPVAQAHPIILDNVWSGLKPLLTK